MNEDQIPMVSLIAHESECSRYCKIIKMLVVFAVCEAVAFGAFALAMAIR